LFVCYLNYFREQPPVEEEEVEVDKDDEDEPDDWLIWPTSEKRRKRNVVDVTDAGNDDKCPDVGVFDLGACKFGAPLFLSW